MLTRLFVIVLVGVAISGCARFKSSQHVDMVPFAEGTIDMVAELSYGMNLGTEVHLRHYREEPIALEYRSRWQAFRPVLRGIATYSLVLVTISKSRISEKDKTDQLASFLDRQYRPVSMRPETGFMLTPQQLDGIVENIRSQKKFLDGIRAAQPLIDEVARFSSTYLDTIKETQDRVVSWLDQRIREDNAGILKYQEVIERAQIRSFDSMVLLANYRAGADRSAITKMLEQDPQLTEVLPSDKTVTTKDLIAVESRLVMRLAELRALKDQLEPDLVQYHSQIQEMDKLLKHANEILARTRITVYVWSRAHDRLAQGITNPAEIDLMGIAKNAVNMAMPF